MLNIYNIHQVITQIDPGRLTHRNCLDYHIFEQFLSSGYVSFGKLKDVLRRREGSGLTIDDATIGAYDAALLCAAHKQHVTWFINPYYLETGRQYHMHYLSQMLEDLGDIHFSFNGQIYDLSRHKQQRHCRKAIKEYLCTLASEEACIEGLEHIFERKISSVQLPYHLRTISKKHLNSLKTNKYVSIEYHGWEHVFPTAMSTSMIMEELESGRSWFRSELQREIHDFSLPFGKRDTRLESIQGFPIILLEDGHIDRPIVKHHVFNRFTIESLLESWESNKHIMIQATEPIYSPDGSILIRYPQSLKETSFTIPNMVSEIGSGAFDGRLL